MIDFIDKSIQLIPIHVFVMSIGIFFVCFKPGCQQHHQTLIIEEFEPGIIIKKILNIKFLFNYFYRFFPFFKDVFRQMIEYSHTGCVTLQPRTLLGVMNAAGKNKGLQLWMLF